MADGQAAIEADAARKEALRKAGHDYFESILAKAASGRDPFMADAADRRKSTDVEALDPDLETFGQVLKGARLYFIGALFFAATALRVALAGVRHKRNPASQTRTCAPAVRRGYVLVYAVERCVFLLSTSFASAGTLKVQHWLAILLPTGS